MERQRLDQILLKLGFVDESQLKRALERQRQRGGRLGTHLIEMRVVTEEQLVMALSEQFQIPSVVPTVDSIDASLIAELPPGFIVEHAVLPLHRDDARGTVTVAVADPTDTEALDRLCSILGLTSVMPMIAPEAVILQLGARLSPEVRQPVELPELFDPASSGALAAVTSGPLPDSDDKNVLMVSASASAKNFLPAVFVREGWHLHVVDSREDFDDVVRRHRFDHVLVEQDMATTFMTWMKETDGAGLGSEISVYPSVSAALIENPAPYDRTVRSVKRAVQMYAELRGQHAGCSVPYGLIARDVEQLARRCGLRQLAVDGLGVALHFLLPGDPFADWTASVEAARQLKFPWRIDAVLERCAARFEGESVDTGGEFDLSAQILALCWHRHVELHLVDAPADEMIANIKKGLRAQAGRLAGLELVESYLRQIDESGRRPAGDGRNQVLVVGESDAAMRPMVDRLRRIGYQPVQASDPADAQAMIARIPPAAILLDYDSFEGECENFCRVHGLNPIAPLFVVMASNDPAAVLALLDAGADDVFAAPHDFDLSVARVDRALRARASQSEAARAVRGQIAATLEAFSFPDLLQSLGHGLKSVRIKLVRGSGEVAVAYLQEGRLVHAFCGDLAGERAVYRVITWQDDGEFVVVPETEFPEPNVQAPLESVLMEGCRILDETLA